MPEWFTRFWPRNWNDVLALFLLGGIPAIWVFEAWTGRNLPGDANGALIATWTLIIQFYFRRAPQP